jgi:BirA family transcriptional regulator, biotin operon repressor / biotin---[acetyl-CoA-carboxylase] ligase
LSAAARHRIVNVAETGSTNKDAMRLALAGEALPLWVSAERQTAGRGRAGRLWISERGNLHASLAVISHAPLARAGELALVAGLALFDTVRATMPLVETIGLRLKWPNDLLIGSAKAGGILVESTTARGEPGFLAVIGFGLNIATCPGDLGRSVTALARHGSAPAISDVLSVLCDQSQSWIAAWDQGRNFDEIRSAWLARGGPIGEPISVQTQSGLVSGTFKGLSASGALLAEVGGQTQTITHGDVSLVAETGKDDNA